MSRESAAKRHELRIHQRDEFIRRAIADNFLIRARREHERKQLREQSCEHWSVLYCAHGFP